MIWLLGHLVTVPTGLLGWLLSQLVGWSVDWLAVVTAGSILRGKYQGRAAYNHEPIHPQYIRHTPTHTLKHPCTISGRDTAGYK